MNPPGDMPSTDCAASVPMNQAPIAAKRPESRRNFQAGTTPYPSDNHRGGHNGKCGKLSPARPQSNRSGSGNRHRRDYPQNPKTCIGFTECRPDAQRQQKAKFIERGYRTKKSDPERRYHVSVQSVWCRAWPRRHVEAMIASSAVNAALIAASRTPTTNQPR